MIILSRYTSNLKDIDIGRIAILCRNLRSLSVSNSGRNLFSACTAGGGSMNATVRGEVEPQGFAWTLCFSAVYIIWKNKAKYQFSVVAFEIPPKTTFLFPRLKELYLQDVVFPQLKQVK